MKLPRRRRTKSEMAEARAAAEMAAAVEAVMPAAHAVLAAASPGQRWVGEKIIRRIVRGPKWSR